MALLLGKIGKTIGLNGEVKLDYYSDDIEYYLSRNVLYMGGTEKKAINVKKWRWKQKVLIIQFEGYEDINLILPLKGSEIFVSSANMKPLEEGEYYIKDLINFAVVNEVGEVIGTVTKIFTTGANDVIRIKNEQNKELLIPFIDDVIKEIDMDKCQINVNLLEGMTWK